MAKRAKRAWLMNEAYDEKVPYSHRVGYTDSCTHCTANDRIRYGQIGHDLPIEPNELNEPAKPIP